MNDQCTGSGGDMERRHPASVQGAGERNERGHGAGGRGHGADGRGHGAGGHGTGSGGKNGHGLGALLRSLFSGIPWREKAERSQTLRLPAPAAGAVQVENANGRTQVFGEERSDILVESTKRVRAENREQAEALLDRAVLHHKEDAEKGLALEVEMPGRWFQRGRADLAIRVPRGTAVSVTSSNGRIFLSGVHAAVTLRSSNGAVRVCDVVGDVEIFTSNAKVHTECTCGKLVARSSNGRIQLARHRGSVDASTSNGTIQCVLHELNEQGCQLVTSNGRITLELPGDVDGELDVRVDNGLIRTMRDFKCAIRERSGRLKATLGRGGAPIRLRASNGAVHLR